MKPRWWRVPFSSLRAAAGVTAILGVLVYLNALPNGFAYDDLHILVDNERIQSLDRFGEAVTTPYWPIEDGRALGLWRPVASGTYALIWNAFDGSPLPFHAVNVLLHGLVTGMVTLLLGALVPVGAALAGGALFAVHPLHSEVVANVVGFAEIAGALAMVGACLMFLRWRGSGFGPGRSALMGAVFAAGLLTKESTITLPGVLFLLDGYLDDLRLRDLGRYLRERWLLYTSLVAAAGLVFVGRHAVLGSIADPLPPLGAELLLEIPRIWTLGEIWTHYVRLLFVPYDLSPEYSPGVIAIHLGWNYVNTLGAILVLGFLMIGLLSWRRWKPAGLSARAVGAGVLWFVITMSPVSNFFFLSGTLLGERTLYTPSIGFSLAAGWAVWALARHRARLAWAGLAVVLVLMSVRTVTRNPVWMDTETVFTNLIDTHLEAGRAQWIVGDTFWEKNEVSSALKSYRYAIGSVGAGYSLISEITKKLLGIERWTSAETLARMLWEDEPSWDAGPGLLTVALIGQERYEEAVESGMVARDLDPDDTVTRHLLSDALARVGRTEEAIVERRAAIELGERGHWQQWFWLAQLQSEAGDPGAARMSVDSARAQAGTPEAVQALDSLSAVLATSVSELGVGEGQTGKARTADRVLPDGLEPSGP